MSQYEGDGLDGPATVSTSSSIPARISSPQEPAQGFGTHGEGVLGLPWEVVAGSGPEMVDRVMYGEDRLGNRLRARGDDGLVLVHMNDLRLPSAKSSPDLEGSCVREQANRMRHRGGMDARTGRECVFMPSGRFAIHLAFQLLLSPTIASSCPPSRTIPCSSAPSRLGCGR
jgi:hypothetical protein